MPGIPSKDASFVRETPRNYALTKAVTPKKIAVTFAGAVEKADKANFSVVDDKNSASFIKSVTLDESKKVATVELYTALTSGKTYKVAVKNGEKTLETTLDYVKGSVAKIEAADQYVLANSAQPIVYTVYDENGLDITEETDVAIDSTVAVDGNNKITLANGVFAYATVVYTNPTNGAQVKSAQFKITGTQLALAKSVDAIAVSSSTITTWPTKDVNTSTSVGNTLDKLYVQYTDIWGTKRIINTDATSLNPEVLIVDAMDNSLKPVKADTATVNVKIGEVEKTFTVTVKDAAKISSIALDASSKTTTSLTVKNHVPTPATAVINVLDQYGAKIAGTVTITATKNNGVVTLSHPVLTTTTSAGATFEFTPEKTGTANFKATVSDAGKVVSTIYFAISVTAADNTMSAIKFNGVKTNFDLNTAAPKAGYETTSPVTISAVNKTGEAIDLDDTTANATVLSDAVVTLTNNETKAVTPLGTTDTDGGSIASLDVASNLTSVGTYTLSVVKNGIAIDSIQITVIDSAEKPAVELKTNYISGKTVIALTTDLITVPNDVTFNGITFDSNNSGVVASVTTPSTANISVGTGTATLYNVSLA